jgi:hypothetical protein
MRYSAGQKPARKAQPMTQFEETDPEEAGFDPGRLSRISDA